MKRDYTKQIAEYWPTIMEAWQAHADKRPIIECDLEAKKVYAYNSAQYMDSLSERTRNTTRRQFAQTMAAGGIMVFVKDTRKRILQSYSFSVVETVEGRKPNKPSHRISNLRRVGKTASS